MMITLSLLLLTGTPALGPIPVPSALVQPLDISEAVQTTIAEFDKTYQAWVTKIQAANPEERKALFEVRPTADDAVKELFALVGTEPASDGALAGLAWIMRAPSPPENAEQALGLLAKHHVDSEDLADIVMRAGGTSETVITALTTIAEKSPHRKVKGCATLSLGKALMGDPVHGKRGEALLEKAAKEYGDIKIHGGRSTIGKVATGQLFESRRLQIGMTVPDIEGEDIDGVEFKLSDYRGKVIMIDFWGDW